MSAQGAQGGLFVGIGGCLGQGNSFRPGTQPIDEPGHRGGDRAGGLFVCQDHHSVDARVEWPQFILVRRPAGNALRIDRHQLLECRSKITVRMVTARQSLLRLDADPTRRVGQPADVIHGAAGLAAYAEHQPA
ncbi:hypothetical protein DLJ59_08435 [Micromonospora inaquosa]|uniref:Uncharacterized protein n=1 Tax=Micromonospora inaquosa TaxID=2203716 RepID=A0A3N9WW41_9ACTN|nr:hypothetical protein DLJ59_08435 [Micromonospora inaquosa]